MVLVNWKTVLWFLIKLNIILPYDPAIVLFSMYPNELKTYVHTENCTQMLIATLFVIAKTWEQTRCPLVGEWINSGTYRQWNIIQC